ncbi:translesion DNA synthesis-associated protein ImuA [Roseateles violae]|uniref:Translesion DNA synthesis-associated protein ImuA n=1 Tax=Roseateles violae TaxID=3058042 RepID=A0ABT8DXI8_9BURK|nr:translesion DNA synthesis-associated protein ImuA [Pelomonas sp. PFR6]MDN3922213.1 translesion DNA synthesis-associated protein ImuA [Pelomonas sp. PFR6]
MHATESALPAPETLHAQLWRASSLGACSSPCLPSGFAALDAELPGGGWPTRGLVEIISPQHAVLEWRLLAPLLSGLCGGATSGRQAAARRPVLLINPPLTPHLPGLQACGLSPQQLIWIAADAPQQQLWATEQAIKSNAAAAILAWLPQARPEQIRRLQAGALASDAPIFLFRPWAVQQQSSAAPLRLLLTPGAGWSLDVRILKRRGPACEGWLSLPSVPAELAPILTPRMLAAGEPPAPIPQPLHVLARPASASVGQR